MESSTRGNAAAASQKICAARSGFFFPWRARYRWRPRAESVSGPDRGLIFPNEVSNLFVFLYFLLDGILSRCL